MFNVLLKIYEVLRIWDVNPGSWIQGSKRRRIPDPGSGSATLVTDTLNLLQGTIAVSLFRLKIGLQVAAVKAPGFGDNRKNTLQVIILRSMVPSYL